MKELKRLDSKKVAKNVYDMIITSDYTIETMARELGISERSIYFWGKQERVPSLNNVYMISQMFQVSLERILE